MNGTKTEIAPGVWRLRVYVGRRANGTPIQRSKTIHLGGNAPKSGAGVRTADRELAKMIADASKGKAATGSETLDQLLDMYLEHAESLGRSPTTLKEYRRLADVIVRPELGKLKLAKLTARDLDQLYARLTKRGLKPTSVRRVHALIGAALHQGEKWDLVDRNVSRRPRCNGSSTRPRRSSRPWRRCCCSRLSPALGAASCARSDGPTSTGRPARSGSLDRSMTSQAARGGRSRPRHTLPRRIGLDELSEAILRRHRGNVDALAAELGGTIAGDAFMFSRSPAGLEPVRPIIVTKFAKRVAATAGVDTHLHALRHFSASQGIAAGYDAVTVGARLGHADPSITLRVYSHVIEQRDKDLAATLGGMLALPS